MRYTSAVVGAVAVLVVASVGGLVAAGPDGPVAQTDDTPATPEGATPTATPDDAVPAASPTPTEPTPSPTAGESSAGAVGSAGGNTTVSVTASASASSAPDTARIRAAVVATAADAETARQRAAENVSATRAALGAAGIADEQVQTTQFDIMTIDEPDGNDTRRLRYRAINEFVIEVAPGRTGEILDVAVGNGTNRINGVTFTLSEETRQALRQQALREAVTNARSDASVIANTSGLALTGVQSATTDDVVFVPFEARTAGGVAAESATTIEPGPVEVSAVVSVTYRAA